MAEDLYRKATQEEIEAERAEARFKYELRYNTDMYYSREEGREEGYAEGEKAGRVEGEKQKQLDIAKALKLRKGMSLDEISEITGLTLAEVETL